MNKKVILALSLLALGTVFCTLNLPDGATPPVTTDIEAAVNATLTAVAAQASTVAPTAAATLGPTAVPTLSTTPMSSFPDTGTISGKLSYPASAIPPLRVVATSTVDGSINYTDLPANTFTYSLIVPVGTYKVIAYTLGGGGYPDGLPGGYTQMVPCGLSASCTDHTLIVVTVTAGATVVNVDPGDWYAPDGTFPPRPGP
jgi:hypothetical protein